MTRSCTNCDREALEGRRICVVCSQIPIPGCDSHSAQIAQGCDDCLARYVDDNHHELNSGIDQLQEINRRNFTDLGLMITEKVNQGQYKPRNLLRTWLAEQTLMKGVTISEFLSEIQKEESFAHLIKR